MKKLIVIFSMIVLTSCLKPAEGEFDYPKDNETARELRRGSLVSQEGGFSLFGGDNKKEASGNGAGIGVNSVLWRAVLDTISFMPLKSADPFGGVVLTDWYSADENNNERFKMNILILSDKLRSDALKVTVFKQMRKNNEWVDVKVDGVLASELENKILTRAREMNVNRLVH